MNRITAYGLLAEAVAGRDVLVVSQLNRESRLAFDEVADQAEKNGLTDRLTLVDRGQDVETMTLTDGGTIQFVAAATAGPRAYVLSRKMRRGGLVYLDVDLYRLPLAVWRDVTKMRQDGLEVIRR